MNSVGSAYMHTLVIIPTYNERENVAAIVRAVCEAVPEVHVLVVDDNSPDGTGTIVQDLMQANSRVHLLSRPQKQGLGRAYLAGFKWALDQGYAAVVEMDADFSHRPEDLKQILLALPQVDFVVGSRYVAGGTTRNWGIGRKIISRGGSFYARTILGFPIYDWTGGFNAWKREVLLGIDYLNVRSEGYSFQIELKYRALKAGFKGREVPILFEDRRVGKSKMNAKIVLEAFYQVWVMRFAVFCLALFLAAADTGAAEKAKAADTGSQPFREVTREATPAAPPAAPAGSGSNVGSQSTGAPATGIIGSGGGSSGQSVVVKTETAIIYEEPDFDASAVAYVSTGETIRVSKKIYGSYQKFFKVRLPNGKFGYISTIDVARAGGDKSGASEKSPDREGEGNRKKNPKAADKTADKSADKTKDKKSRSRERRREIAARVKTELGKPMIFNRWIGFLGGNLAFSEKFGGARPVANIPIYGMKITGPDVLLGGPIMDLNLFLHLGAPAYYNELSRIKPTGFVFMTDALLLMPLMTGQKSAFYIGIGPLLKYSSFKLVPKNGPRRSPVEFSLGASSVAGFAYRLGTVSLRLEGKYLYERSAHTMIQVGLQTLY